MPHILRNVRVRFLRRRPGSSVSLLTARDVMPEPFTDLPARYESLLDCVWACERRERQNDRIDGAPGRAPA